jgi:nucleoside-diphosphate-sugar epimerase
VAGDALDAASVRAAVASVRPEVVIHQLTKLPKRIDPRRVAEQLADTNRLRTEGTRHLAAAARAAGARRLVAQSIAFAYAPGGATKTEDDPLYLDAPPSFRSLIRAVADLEATTTGTPGLEGVALRYGFFYGPGTAYAADGTFADAVRQRRVPVVGAGDGVFSFIHLDDAVAATIAALGDAPSGVYNVVDDDPAPVREWLPFYAEVLGAPRPRRVPRWLGRLGAGAYADYLMVQQRGASNARARRLLGWAPRWTTWREGFRDAPAT